MLKKRVLAFAAMLSLAWPALGASAIVQDETQSLNRLEGHDHKPIHVRSKPVIERLAVKVIEPVDLKLTQRGLVLVADRQAECVFQLDADANVSLLVERLPDIQRIQVDAMGSLYVLTSTDGESSLYQVTSNGRRLLLATFPFPARCFARDNVGHFAIAVCREGRIVSLSPDGLVSNLTSLPAEAFDLTHTAGGKLEALVSSGHIVQIDEAGGTSITGFAPVNSTRLTSLGDGSVLALSDSVAGRSQIVYVSRHADRPEEFQIAATVPAGTRAVGFDSLGNLCLANPDLRAVTKVTSHFEVPCPHCGKLVPMILNSDSEASVDSKHPSTSKSRTF